MKVTGGERKIISLGYSHKFKTQNTQNWNQFKVTYSQNGFTAAN